MSDGRIIIEPDWSEPLNSGLVGWWLASGKTGWGTQNWYDISGYGNHGTLTGMDPMTDWRGETHAGGMASLDFDGSNDYISAGSGQKLDMTSSPITLCGWILRHSDTIYNVIVNVIFSKLK